MMYHAPNARFLFALSACLLTTLAWVSGALAQADQNNYERIEETWEVKLNTPDASDETPQIAFWLKPAGSSPFTGVFLLNFRDEPSYQQGGVQVQLWHGETLRAQKSYGTALLNTQDETITFTLYAERNGTALSFGAMNGASTTWGNLALGNLHIATPDTTPSFMNYKSSDSIANLELPYGASRIKSIKLTQVRKKRVTGNVWVTETSQNAYP